ncbi:MAG TPA: nitrate reductase cytochrome c-type subunit [Clostridia bacterium]|nr:nitrate reductase cytochrome c-type subunit [Clostridia bacterium]
MNPINPITYRRAAWIVGVILVTASVSGYFMGLQQTGSQLNPTPAISLVSVNEGKHSTEDALSVKRATRYAEQHRLQDGPNADWNNALSKLVQPTVDFRSFTNVTEAQRTLALNERADRRAYDGAPPVVPHPIAQDSSASCLACHGQGLVVKDKVATKISHAPYTSCTQCHVPAVGTRIPTAETALLEPSTANQFTGLRAPLKGSRAWPQAPPTVPHGTFMRADCLSCHGPQGLFGLRTPHPDRRSCLQCHAPAAELDQQQFFSGSSTETPLPLDVNLARQ